MKCATCGREYAGLDGGFWERVGRCPRCGTFAWDRSRAAIVEVDPLAYAWWRMFIGIGDAIETHKAWLAAPWLTKPICACHPNTHLS